MHLDWWTLGLQTINLLVLLWLLGRFLFQPMARIVAQRQQAAAKLLGDAEAERAKAAEALAGTQRERGALESQKRQLIKEAQAEAEATRTAIVGAARKEAHRIEEDAKNASTHLRAQAAKQVERDASRLATEIAARLLQGPAKQIPLTGFLGGFENALASLPAEVRERIGLQGKPLTVSLSRTPSPDDREALLAALTRALGREVEFDTVVDPELIGGLALETDMAAIENSLRSDLSHVLDGLDDHDRH